MLKNMERKNVFVTKVQVLTVIGGGLALPLGPLYLAAGVMQIESSRVPTDDFFLHF